MSDATSRLTAALAAVVTLTALSQISTISAADTQRLQEVRAAGEMVMPFDLDKTQHSFVKEMSGGTQSVVARNPDDQNEIELIRTHLKEIAAAFSAGDFSNPMMVHGTDMPGIATLSAKSSALSVSYEDLSFGARLTYSSADPEVVTALHQWFDAQLADHGSDATDQNIGGTAEPSMDWGSDGHNHQH